MFDHGTIPALERPPPKASAIIPDPINPTFVLFALIVVIKRESFLFRFLFFVICVVFLPTRFMFRVSISIVKKKTFSSFFVSSVF